MSKRALVAIIIAASLAAPSAALGHPPTSTDRKNASQECRAERGTTDAERQAFAHRYGTEKSGFKNAFGKCVSSRGKNEHAERHAAKSNASRDCREERKSIGEQAFGMKYGTAGSNYRNAFGKCVSRHAKKHEAAADREDRELRKRRHNAAQACADEREAMGEAAFEQKWGTPQSKHSNAFGKCVSEGARS